jgi:prepilin-type N-terminal cleavage/methylation domain-containing protein
MHNGPNRSTAGFTLVELLVVLAIGVILLAVGVPSLTYMIDRNRVAGEVNEMLADLALTRSEALARRGRVILCISADVVTNPETTATCGTAATNWAATDKAGWIVFVDDTSSGSLTTGTPFQRDIGDAVEALIRAYARASTQITITAAPAVAGISVTADGTVFLLDGNPLSSLNAAAEPLRFDFAGTDPSNKRSLCISTTGQARLSNSFGGCT